MCLSIADAFYFVYMPLYSLDSFFTGQRTNTTLRIWRVHAFV